jgi:putative Ca2+/H+ antiporter (TMEM165/GDT1 family)
VLTAFVVATVLITFAELGDKTQLLALCLAAKYKAWQVLVGIFVATLAIHLLSTAVGGVVGNLVPAFWLRLLTGVLFVGFGIWTLRGEDEEECETEPSRYGPIAASGVAFFLAELGDKTQLMTMSIAADPAAATRALGSFGARLAPVASTATAGAGTFIGVWLGSTAGMMIADGLAIIVGAVLGKALPERLITRIAGVFFILFGIAAFVSAFIGRA